MSLGTYNRSLPWRQMFQTTSRHSAASQWRHDERGDVSNHQRLDCLLNHLFKRRLNKTSKLRITGLCRGNSPVTGEFHDKGPVTRKMFPFDDVIMEYKAEHFIFFGLLGSWILSGQVDIWHAASALTPLKYERDTQQITRVFIFLKNCEIRE